MVEKLIPFNDFIKSLHEKKIEHFKSKAGFMVKNDHEFEKMNQHQFDYSTARERLAACIIGRLKRT